MTVYLFFVLFFVILIETFLGRWLYDLILEKRKVRHHWSCPYSGCSFRVKTSDSQVQRHMAMTHLQYSHREQRRDE